jgi:hypothetical protein
MNGTYAAEVAGIWEALGDNWRAALYRDLGAPDPDPVTSTELAFAIESLINQVPETVAKGKHDENCWKRHAACLVDRIAELLPS